MKKILLLALCLLFNSLLKAQVVYKEVNSKKLNATRKLKIQLPRNYKINTDKKYPIILVLDGDYLFEPVAGNVDYLSYWEDMPEAIVVAIIQGNERYRDGHFDELNYMPAEQGAEFFEFIGLELIPHLDKEYRTAKFIIAVGHDFTANFINYYLFKDPVLFNGYINLSPDFAPLMENRIAERIPAIKEKIFYYLATGTDDIKGLRSSAESLNTKLRAINNTSFHYYYDDFPEATHYSLVSRGIPNAFEKIFSVYRPISNKEFTDVLMKMEVPIHQYLLDRYGVVENLFGIKNNIRINDFIATATAAEKIKQWESLRNIAALAQKQYPNKVLGDYFMARYYEETGNPKKAMRLYQGAHTKEEVDFITVDLMMDRAENIRRDFGN